MTTELINIADYRKNISTLWKKAEKEKIKYLVMVHWKPAFEVVPVSESKIDDDWTEYTYENHNNRIESIKELESWKTTEIDFNKIKSEDDFISFLKK